MNVQGRNKNSRLSSGTYDWTLNRQGAVYTNQLRAFSAVAGPALLALQQTETFREKLEALWALITMGSITIQVIGSDRLLTSEHCLGRQFCSGFKGVSTRCKCRALLAAFAIS